jgi:hypothetical protein
MRISIDYSALSLLTVMILILLSCHWTACIWGLTANMDPINSWAYGTRTDGAICVDWADGAILHANGNLTMPGAQAVVTCEPGHVCEPGTCRDHGAGTKLCTGGHQCAGTFGFYIYALYFAIMTITSVGYGDISARADNVGEQIVCSLIMLGSGMLWGYLIGIFCTLATASPSTQAFRDELSQLNKFMQTYSLDSDLRFRLREFVHETVHLRDAEAQRGLLTKLSPTMQGEVSLLVNRQWLGRIWYLRGADLGLVIDIASRLRAQIFAPLEFCPSGALYIISRGMALWAAQLRRAGGVCGDDVLIQDVNLRLSFSAVAATYLWVFSMNGSQLHKALDNFPVCAASMLSIARRWSIRRAVVRLAERECHARGYNFRGRMFPIYAKV